MLFLLGPVGAEPVAQSLATNVALSSLQRQGGGAPRHSSQSAMKGRAWAHKAPSKHRFVTLNAKPEAAYSYPARSKHLCDAYKRVLETWMLYLFVNYNYILIV